VGRRNPAAFAPRDSSAATAPADAVQKMRGDVLRHVERNALPALRIFLAQGPESPLGRAGTGESLRYLQGLSVYLDRVYGSASLRRGFAPLSIKPLPASTVTTRRAVGTSRGQHHNLACCGPHDSQRFNCRTRRLYTGCDGELAFTVVCCLAA
jgi:hypothetical protein